MDTKVILWNSVFQLRFSADSRIVYDVTLRTLFVLTIHILKGHKLCVDIIRQNCCFIGSFAVPGHCLLFLKHGFYYFIKIILLSAISSSM